MRSNTTKEMEANGSNNMCKVRTQEEWTLGRPVLQGIGTAPTHDFPKQSRLKTSTHCHSALTCGDSRTPPMPLP
jgi:hypothetical protein